MTTLGIILARGGSKGLPDKNGLLVADRPMLVWTIEHAMRSRSLRHTVLSTDTPTYKQIAQEHALHVIDRPETLAADAATVDAAARHALEIVEAERGAPYDNVVILYGNVPVRPVNLTDRAVAKLHETGCDSVQSICPVDKMHPYWMKKLAGNTGDRLEQYQDNIVYRRQDLPPVYMLDGGVIAVTRASLFNVVEGQPHAFLGNDRRAIVTQAGEVIDVDSELDRKLAEIVLREGWTPTA
ncbi:cytidylyltransferase domain-containing protein [Phycisphaerales bacterium AB-hyl4]|uniref:Cytidylyltransferase domain-containing protein n=1 Tax=Natronomicrosphaera hydrolytica TaxID=3242702 RepID=A0ABV4U118_9BACT